MPKRKKKGKVKTTAPTRKQIIRSRRDKELHRYLIIGLSIIAAAIVGLLAAALIQEFVVKPRVPIAIVNGVEIRTADYQKRVLLEWDNVQRQLNRWIQLEAQYGSGEGMGLFQQQVAQLRSRLENPDLLSLQVLNQMVDEELIRQKAMEEGLLVTEAEIREEIERQFGYVRNPTPTPVVTPAVITRTEVITGSDGLTTTRVITATATPQPTAPLMTEEQFRQAYDSAMKRLYKTLGITEADFRKMVEASLLEQKLRQWLGERVPTTEEQVRARHILFKPDPEAEDKEAALEEARKRAEEAFRRLQAGEDFAQLAEELSDDLGSKDKGGDLGWFGRGRMQPEFETMAFSLPVGEISEPFTTTYGYHILQVLERDPQRELDEFTLAQRRNQALDEWLQEQRRTAQIERFWSPDKMPSLPTPSLPPF